MGRKREGFKLKKYSWSPFWYITGIPGKTNRVSTDEESREEAEQRRAEFILELGKRQQQENKLTVADCIEDYMREHTNALPSADTTRYYSKPLVDYFGAMLPESLTPAIVKAFTAKQANENYKAGTIRRQLTVLSASLNHAQKERRIEIAPFISMPAQSPAKERWLIKKEAIKLLAACENAWLKMFVVLGLYTGQRKAAILELKWSMVDMKAREIDFNAPGRIQTAKKRTKVPMPPELFLHLNAEKYRKGNVVNRRGEAIKDIKKGFAQACKDAGLKGVTPHTLRHTCGTWLAQAGVPIWEISGVLGHSMASTTELYLKHSPDHLRTSMNRLQLASNSSAKQSKMAKNREGKKRA